MTLAEGKRYVDVIVRWKEDGSVVPMSVCWPDGRTFDIGRIFGQSSSAAPGSPSRTVRYSVRVGGRTTRLFLECGEDGEPARWYVEDIPGMKPWRFGGRQGRVPNYPAEKFGSIGQGL